MIELYYDAVVGVAECDKNAVLIIINRINKFFGINSLILFTSHSNNCHIVKDYLYYLKFI